MPNDAYKSEKWLKMAYYRKRMSVEEIAKYCGVSQMTIYRYIDKFGMKR